MSKRIVAPVVALLAVLAFAAPGLCAPLVVLPETLIPSSKAVADGDFVKQNPEGVFALSSSTVEFWAPLKLAVGSKIKALSYDHSDFGGTSVGIYRVRTTGAGGLAEEIVKAAGAGTGGGWRATAASIPYPHHTVAAGYRYYIKVFLGNDCMVGKTVVVR